jgi:hypothetical protein
MALQRTGSIQRLSNTTPKARTESRSSTLGHITLGRKQTGAPRAGNPYAGCDEAGAGDGLTVRIVRHSQRKQGANKIGRTYGAPRQSSTLLTIAKLLTAIDAAEQESWLAQIPAVVLLRRLWSEQFTGEPGKLSWREVKDMPSPAGPIASPYDPEGALQHQSGGWSGSATKYI